MRECEKFLEREGCFTIFEARFLNYRRINKKKDKQ
jgi:membrane protein DedA with SNARE-associated domain